MTNSKPLPLGAREDVRMEFKRKAILQNLESIAAVVASFLNTEGGELWIGVEEKDELAIGLEDIEDVAREVRRVQDVLIDTLEPSPTSEEVRVEPVIDDAGSRIRVQVTSSQRGPVAQLRKNEWRRYVVRVGARMRLMTHEELRERFAEPNATQEHELRRLRAFDEAWNSEVSRTDPVLWIRVAIEPPVEIPRNRPTRELLTRLLRDPEATGNRAMGWNFCVEVGPVELTGRGSTIEVGGPTGYTWTTFERDGTIVFRAPIERLEHKAAGEIYPYALVEFPVSVVRLARALYEKRGADDSSRVSADLALRGVGEKVLRPGSPRALSFALREEHPDGDDVRSGVQMIGFDELRHAPDRFGWQLVRRIYEGFGFWEDDMPREIYDDERGRLLFSP